MRKAYLFALPILFVSAAMPNPANGIETFDEPLPHLIPTSAGQQFIPDVMGRCNLSATTRLESAESDSEDVNRAINLYFNWPQSAPGRQQRGGVYANLDLDPELEILYTIGSQISAWNIDGTPVPGWPQALIFSTSGAPACGDVDGDGDDEIVVCTSTIDSGNEGYLHVFERDGSIAEGFPIALHGGGTRTPALGNIDDDEALEIVIAERDWPRGFVCVYNGDGTTCPGWPVKLDHVPGSAAAVGDLNDDGLAEIVAESYYSVYVFNTFGNTLTGFPYTPGHGRVFSYSTPVLADLNGDGQREIICGDHSITDGDGKIHVIRNDGFGYPGWPPRTAQWIYGPPAVGDIDGDGSPDIAVGDQILSGMPIDSVYAWDNRGDLLPGFPVGPIWAVNSQIILADLDDDQKVELIFDDNTGLNQYLGYNHDGSPMEGWPLNLSGSSFFTNPFVVDIDGDGELDMSGGGHSEGVSFIHLWDANVPDRVEYNFLTMLQYGPRHDGVYDPDRYLTVDFTRSEETGMLNCMPNPCCGLAMISIPETSSDFLGGLPGEALKVSIYRADGRKIRSLSTSGRTVIWRGADDHGRPVSSGSYWAVTQMGTRTYTRRLLLAR